MPSITSYPVYLGNFTDLFMPWDDEVSNPQTKEILKLFLKHIDKTLCDSFVHANIGPKDSKITRLILNLTKEMQLAIPNITLLYDDDITPHDLAIASIDTMLYTSKPSLQIIKCIVRSIKIILMELHHVIMHLILVVAVIPFLD